VNGENLEDFTIAHCPFTLLNLHTTVAKSTGRCSTEAEPEDLPGLLNNHSKLSGERHGM